VLVEDRDAIHIAGSIKVSWQFMAAKVAFRVLVEETVLKATTNGMPLARLRGTAFFDPSRDALITSLPSFAQASQSIISAPNFVTHIGAQEVTRATLQFIYQYFARVDNVRYEEAAFESLWEDFTAEIQDPQWVTRGLANVRYFKCESPQLDLGDGIVIKGRDFDDLASLGFVSPILERLSEDWSGLGASSFVLVAEHSVAKNPDNVITLESGMVFTKALRAVGALRLADAGSVSIGRMWMIRAARFNFGIGGLQAVGVSIPAIGSQFVWSEKSAHLFPKIYRELAQLEQEGYGRSPGNLAVALRAFMATYDRWPSSADSQLLDSITALEALLGNETEISFKLAFRVASLLANNDDKRAELLRLVKGFYDTRSRLVHGGQLKEKHQQYLARIEDLRVLVRRLLRSFVTFAATPPGVYGRKFFAEQLDVALVDAVAREKLRFALGLDED